MNDFHNSVSRSDTRIKKRKQNRILNSLIFIVAVLIVAVGWSIFTGDSEQAGTTSGDNTEQTAASENGNGQGQEDSIVVSDPENSEGSNSDNQDETTNNGENQNDSKETDKQDDKMNDENSQNQTDAEVLKGPWEPVGTQQESYEPNYDDQSLNWDEMVTAILVPTGFSKSEITLWRLENGGTAKKAVGKYSLKGKPEKLYVVHIQWIDEKGWKPVEVQIRQDNPYNDG